MMDIDSLESNITSYDINEPVHAFTGDTTGAAYNLSRSLSYEEVINFLSNAPEELCTCWPPSNQKHGDIFIFRYDDHKHHFDFVADCMNWRNQGTRVYSKDGCVMKKRYYQRRIGKVTVDFRKTVYELSDVKRVLIHYLGTRFEELPEAPHGNRKKNLEKGHLRVMPSVIANIKENRDNIGEAYMKMITECKIPPESLKVARPRNQKQVENGRRFEKKQMLVDKCDPAEMYSLLQLNTELSGFIKYLAFIPTVNVVLINEPLMHEWLEILSTGEQCILSLVTGFKFQDYYVSALVAQHSHFEESPGFSFAYLIHHRNNSDSYKLLFKELRNLCPITDNQNVIFVSTREKAISDAWAHIMPNANHFICWNDIRKLSSISMKKIKVTGTQKKNILCHIDSLLEAKSEEEFYELLSEYRATWSDEFSIMFEKQLKEVIRGSMRSCLLQSKILMDEYGIRLTNCDGLSVVQHGLMEWSECNIYSVCLSLYMLGSYYLTELTKSFSGVGQWTLHKHYSRRELKTDDLHLRAGINDPADIIRIVQNRKEVFAD